MTKTTATEDRKLLDSERLIAATLELGQNWAIAVLVASFAAANWHKDVALESWLSREVVLYGGIIFAFCWILIGVARFLTAVNVRMRSRLQTAVAYAISLVLIVIGVGLIMAVGHFADNANAVATCSGYASQPEHKLHHDPVCQRLYEFRAAKERRMTGE